MDTCLLLNADASPKSLLPLSSLSWQEAVKLLYLQTATAIHTYEDWHVHSPSVTMAVPSVIMLVKYAKFRPYTQATKRGALFLRDHYQCLYCLNTFSENELTIDHVLPRSLGGGTNWRNCVTCCGPCNLMRGNNVKIRPFKEPYQPTYQELIRKRKMFAINIPHASWIDYLDWSDNSLIKLKPPSQ
jgi:5-methylcytosine-specific restriction endonuclease McrA